VLQRDSGIRMPRRMQVEFSAIVQALADTSETELSSAQIWAIFEQTYLAPTQVRSSLIYRNHRLFEHLDGQGIALELADSDGAVRTIAGSGNGPIAATVAALGLPLRIDSFEERSLAAGSEAAAVAIVEAAMPGVPGSRFGVGRHPNIATASVLAVLSAAARFADATD
tara:strand:- start:47709 stop:48212 length:504 start_codon:yes stop_codon:yes gene_type:complete